MLFGIKMMLNNELCVEYNLSPYLTIENKKADVKLPESAKPIPLENTIRILYAEFSPRLIYQGDVDDTLKGWNYLEDMKIPLGKVSIVLAMAEIFTILTQKFWSVKPLIVSPAEISYLIHLLRCQKVKNLEYVIPKVRRKINGSLRFANKKLKRGTLPSIAAMSLIETLASIESELWISRELVEGGFNIAFNPHAKGPDLYVNQKGVKLEITKKAEHWNIKEYEMWMKIAKESPAKSFIPFHPTALLVTLSLNLAHKLEEELGQGDIVVVDISSLFEGFMLLASKYFSEKPEELDFKEAMMDALKRLEEGEKSVILYVRSRDLSAAWRVDAKVMVSYINIIKERAASLISLRKKYPYTTIKIFSELMKFLDEKDKK